MCAPAGGANLAPRRGNPRPRAEPKGVCLSDAPFAAILASIRQRGVGLYLRGVAMGAADVIPGVSGGTIALVTGIYDELVGTIAGVNADVMRSLAGRRWGETLVRVNVGFLAPLLLGIGTAIVALARIILYMMETHPRPVWGFLTGLILASALVVARHMGGRVSAGAAAVLVGAALGYGVTLIVPLETGVEWWKFVVAGSIASVAMILPGISGSFLLVLMGKYQQVLAAVNERDPVVVVLFGVGFVAGILAFSRVLKRLLARHHATTMAFLVGLMLGSLRKVWPFRQYSAADGGETYSCALPESLDGDVLSTIAMMAIGIVAVLAIERLGARRPS